MTATTFNPLEAVRDLEAAGVERRQAEAIAEGMRRAATARHSRGSGNHDTLADEGRYRNVAMDVRLPCSAQPRDGRQAVRRRLVSCP